MDSLTIPVALIDQMQAEAVSSLPEEACGLLAGIEGLAMTAIPVENILHSPVRFRMEPRRQLEALEWIEKMGWQLLAIYHSHPEGPDRPSKTDIDEAAYPGVIHLIWSRIEGRWIYRAFWIESGQAQEASIIIASP